MLRRGRLWRLCSMGARGHELVGLFGGMKGAKGNFSLPLLPLRVILRIFYGFELLLCATSARSFSLDDISFHISLPSCLVLSFLVPFEIANGQLPTLLSIAPLRLAFGVMYPFVCLSDFSLHAPPLFWRLYFCSCICCLLIVTLSLIVLLFFFCF